MTRHDMTRKKPAAADVAVTLSAAADLATRPGRVRHLPTGWSGKVSAADREALIASGALAVADAPEPAADPEDAEKSE